MNLDIIETQNLILKGFTPEDMKFVFENYSEPEIKIILGHRSDVDFQKERDKYLKGYSSYNRSFKLFLITHKAHQVIIGRCGIHNWNVDHKRAEIGYVMELESYKKQGLMSEAVNAVIAHGFNKLELNRLEALVAADNIPSLKIIEKYKFKREGVLRQHYYTSERFEDSVVFSILRNEYFNH